jgi:hypothetical protein
MTEEDGGAGELGENKTRLRLVKGPLAGPVLGRVVSMILTRADWPVDRMHEAMLVCDALTAHAPAYASDGRVTFALSRQGERVELRVEDLASEGAAAILREAMLPGVGNVLEKIPESVEAELLDDGGSRLVLVLSRR